MGCGRRAAKADGSKSIAAARRYAASRGFLPDSAQYGRLLRGLTLERLLQLGGGLVLLGGIGVYYAFSIWRTANFGPLNYPDAMRILIPSVTVIASGVQLALAAFLASVMEIDSKV